MNGGGWNPFFVYLGVTEEKLEEDKRRGDQECERECRLEELAEKQLIPADGTHCICGSEIGGRTRGGRYFKVCNGLAHGDGRAVDFHKVALPPSDFRGWECSH